MGIRNPIIFCLFASLLLVMVVIYLLSAPANQNIPQTKYRAHSKTVRRVDKFPRSCYQCYEDKCQLLAGSELTKIYCRQRLPQLFNIGPEKSGTTTLTKFMDLHPTLAGTTFSLQPNDLDKNINDIADIITKQMYFTTPGQITFQNDPDFFSFDMRTLKRLALLVKEDVPLIMLFRNPVKRAISDYVHVKEMMDRNPELVWTEWMDTKSGREKVLVFKTYEIRDTFEATVLDEQGNVRQNNQLIETGIYIKHVTSLLDTFKLRQMLFLDGELFSKDPLPILREVEEFLGIPQFYERKHFRFVEDKGFHCAFVSERPDVGCMDTINGPRNGHTHLDVDQAVIDKLDNFFRPHTTHLQNVIGKTFSWTFNN